MSSPVTPVEVLRNQRGHLIMALARNGPVIPQFATTLEADGVIPETVYLKATNQHSDAADRASQIISSCISSVDLTPSKFALIVRALRDVGLNDLGNCLNEAFQGIYYPPSGALLPPLDEELLQKVEETIREFEESNDEITRLELTLNELVHNPAIIQHIKKLIIGVLDGNIESLKKAFYGSIMDIAKELNERDIVSNSVFKVPTFDAIIDSFKSGLELTDSNLESYCFDFLQGLRNIGGPVKRAAIMLEKKWIEAVRKETGVQLQFK